MSDSFHVSFKAVLNIMVGKPVFEDSHTREEVKTVVELWTGMSSDDPAFDASAKRVQEYFCKHFAHIYDNMMRTRIAVFKNHLKQYRPGSDEYLAAVNNWLQNMEKNGFYDFILEPIKDGTEKHRSSKARSFPHKEGIVKHKQSQQAAA